MLRSGADDRDKPEPFGGAATGVRLGRARRIADAGRHGISDRLRDMAEPAAQQLDHTERHPLHRSRQLPHDPDRPILVDALAVTLAITVASVSIEFVLGLALA